MKKKLFLFMFCLLLVGCSSKNPDAEQADVEKKSVSSEEAGQKDDKTVEEVGVKVAETAELQVPDKDVVLETRKIALEGMDPDDIDRLKSVIKSANQSLEFLYIFGNLEYCFSDPESYYWRYLEQTGEFVQGYLYFEGMKEQGEALGLSKEEIEQQFGEPVYANNEYDAERIIQLINELQSTIHNETFKQNFTNMAEYVRKAKDTHDVNYILNTYRILHDMDYYLLRYGPEDVGPYVEDTSTIDLYYGILEDYRNTEYYSEEAILSC